MLFTDSERAHGAFCLCAASVYIAHAYAPTGLKGLGKVRRQGKDLRVRVEDWLTLEGQELA
jgi:hypothetical protein